MSIIIPEQLTTSRLLIRKPVPEDAERIFNAYTQDPEVTRYLTWKPHTSLEMSEAYINWCLREWQKGSRYAYIICLKESGTVIGMIDTIIEDCKADLGYVLAQPYWKKGYMVEAVSAVAQWLLSIDQIYRVWAVCDIDNYGSKRVMEKAGMIYEGILHKWLLHPNVRSTPNDCYVFSICK